MTFPAAFLKKMKKQLEEEKERLSRDLHDLAEEDPHQPGVFLPKPSDQEVEMEDDVSVQATTMFDELPAIEDLRQNLESVEKSLQAIEDGTYGICKYCKKPIDPKRLEARPTSSACIACKKTLTQEL